MLGFPIVPSYSIKDLGNHKFFPVELEKQDSYLES